MTAAYTLKKLAKSYSQGEIDKASYRSARTKLLDAVVLGETDVEDLEFLPPVVPVEASQEDITGGLAKSTQQQAEATTKFGYQAEKSTSAAEVRKMTSATAGRQKGSKSGNKTLIYGLIGGIVLLIIALVLSLGRNLETEERSPTSASADEDTAPVDSNATAATTADELTAVSKITTAASALIDSFLSEKDWSEQRLEKFVQQWQKLSKADRLSVKGSGEYSQLINAIYKQLLEEKALSAIGDADAARSKQQFLVDFASRLGIKDNRIKLSR